MNYSIPFNNTNQNGITDTCFNWCKSQHFANDYQNMYIVLFAIILLAVYLFLNHVKENNENIPKLMNGIIYSCIFLLSAFAWFTLK